MLRGHERSSSRVQGRVATSTIPLLASLLVTLLPILYIFLSSLSSHHLSQEIRLIGRSTTTSRVSNGPPCKVVSVVCNRTLVDKDNGHVVLLGLHRGRYVASLQVTPNQPPPSRSTLWSNEECCLSGFSGAVHWSIRMTRRDTWSANTRAPRVKSAPGFAALGKIIAVCFDVPFCSRYINFVSSHMALF